MQEERRFCVSAVWIGAGCSGSSKSNAHEMVCTKDDICNFHGKIDHFPTLGFISKVYWISIFNCSLQMNMKPKLRREVQARLIRLFRLGIKPKPDCDPYSVSCLKHFLYINEKIIGDLSFRSWLIRYSCNIPISFYHKLILSYFNSVTICLQFWNWLGVSKRWYEIVKIFTDT